MMRRRSSVAVAVGVVGALTITVLGGDPATALRQDPFVLTPESSPHSVEYGPVSGSQPLTGLAGEEERARDPDSCNTSAACDTIPLEIHVPQGLREGDDVRVVIELEPLNPEEFSDLDLYLWDNGEQKEDPGAEESRYNEINSSASADAVERILFLNPSLPLYYLTVNVWQGPTDGYRITASMSTDKFTRPFESLEPPPPGGTNDEPTDFGPPPTEAPLPELPSSGSPPPTLDIIDTPIGDSLDVDVPDFDDQLAAPRLGFEQAAETTPEDVSTLALVLTLLVLPVVGIGGGSGWMWLRRRRGLAGLI